MTPLENPALSRADERASLADESVELSLLREAVQAMPIAAMCVGAKSGRYAFLNQAFAELIGRPHEELLSADPYEVWITATHPDDVAVEREALERLAGGEISRYRLEKRLVRDGEARWVVVDLSGVRDAEGRLSHVIAYFRELSEQREATATRERLEAQLRQAQKLGSLGKLAGGVAHDFNNRLVIIMGYTELIKRGLPADSPLLSHADMVLTSAQRASELTRQLLAYSQRQVLSPQSFDLNQTVERMRRLLERLIGDDVEFTSELRAQHPIFSDPGQIEQVIMNLVINARDAMPTGGKLLIETRDVSFGLRDSSFLPPGDYVVMSTTDTGTGISADVLSQIFEPFFTTKELHMGSGLGLSTVEGIVKQSGGSVQVRSRVGVGTTFDIYLPRARELPAPPRYAAESAPPRELAFETVLVCDDDEGVRQLIADVLGFRAYSVLQANSGAQALELSKRHPDRIHLLITDLVMPGLSGVALARELRARDPSLKVLYISGYSDDPAGLTATLGEHAHFLAKPFLPGDLTQAVCSILEKR